MTAETGLPERTIYDEVPYGSIVRTATHVDHIAAIGRLLGMQTADPRECRVLELGCGDGANLIPMALGLPGSDFIGLDLAPSAIGRGLAAASATGATNVTLLQADIASLDADPGGFDYVIAHGVYSWVAAPVRKELLRVIRERMRPNGLAFVSYNALPGDHIRGIVRQMMRMHTAGIEDPTHKLQQARALLQLLSQAPGAAGDVYRPLLQSEIGRAMQSSDDLLFHDDLADISQPFFFTEFMGAARAAGLQFAAEALFHSMSVAALPPDIARLLGDLSTRDVIAKEQYLDFLTCRGFRQTLLAHEDVQLSREINTERMRQFRFCSDAVRKDDEADPSFVSYEHRNGSALRTDDPATKRALEAIIDEAPRSVPFATVAARAGAQTPAAEETLASALFQAYSVGLLELRLQEPEIVTTVSDRPMASAWARYEAPRGRAANVFHEPIQLDEPAQKLLPLADGIHTIDDLAVATGLDADAVRRTIAELAMLGLFVG